MANLTVTDCHLIGNPGRELTLPASVALTKGQVVRPNTTGRWALANALNATNAGRPYVITADAAVNETVTGYRMSDLDCGEAFAAMGFNAPVYLSDTDGTMSDTPGTVSVILGYIAPAAVVSTGDADRMLRQEA